MTPTTEELNRLMALREELFAEIKRLLEEDGHCKSYEGHFAYQVSFPNYFEQDGRTLVAPVEIRLNCYLVGPHRHYRWTGKTFDECLRKVETDVRAWIGGDDESRHFEENF